jgi:putative protease
VQTAEQLTPALAELSPACVYVPLEVLFQRPECVRPLTERGCGVAAALPPVACGSIEEKKLRTMLSAVRENGVEEALTGNIGLALMAGQEGFKLRGDLELSINNDYALQRLKETGFVSATLSPELTLDQIRLLNKPLDTEIAVYGRLPVMVTETCLLKTSAGRCTCTTPGQMADTQGGVWPVTRSFGCRNSVWMNKKLWLEDVAQDWVQSGLWAGRLIFSTESPRECVDVADSYIHATGYVPNGVIRGMYFRGTL